MYIIVSYIIIIIVDRKESNEVGTQYFCKSNRQPEPTPHHHHPHPSEPHQGHEGHGDRLDAAVAPCPVCALLGQDLHDHQHEDGRVAVRNVVVPRGSSLRLAHGGEGGGGEARVGGGGMGAHAPHECEVCQALDNMNMSNINEYNRIYNSRYPIRGFLR